MTTSLGPKLLDFERERSSRRSRAFYDRNAQGKWPTLLRARGVDAALSYRAGNLQERHGSLSSLRRRSTWEDRFCPDLLISARRTSSPLPVPQAPTIHRWPRRGHEAPCHRHAVTLDCQKVASPPPASRLWFLPQSQGCSSLIQITRLIYADDSVRRKQACLGAVERSARYLLGRSPPSRPPDAYSSSAVCKPPHTGFRTERSAPLAHYETSGAAARSRRSLLIKPKAAAGDRRPSGEPSPLSGHVIILPRESLRVLKRIPLGLEPRIATVQRDVKNALEGTKDLTVLTKVNKRGGGLLWKDSRTEQTRRRRERSDAGIAGLACPSERVLLPSGAPFPTADPQMDSVSRHAERTARAGRRNPIHLRN
ncbi:hypothetical protein SKAU_G00390060 [Synaphobranchus kaupii]|uniref:Uncharacterized protein n=1 Tax=Synaphobranchus kaupii TaxID=118154 RepID=A0A9Q1EBD5_SYNKA|nr:hypothetical protein SKAU_G00390060 [Synaphobranchus kaupii]